MNKYFILFAFCKPVRGRNKSIICNLQKAKIKFIPNSLYDVLQLLASKPYSEVSAMFNKNELSTFNEYINFLIKENFGFFTNCPENFGKLETFWDTPQFINNAIVEYAFSGYNIHSLLQQLDNLLCKHVELRIFDFDKKNLSELYNIMQFFEDKTFVSVTLILTDAQSITEKEIDILINGKNKLTNIIFYSSSTYKNKIINNIPVQYQTEIFDTASKKEFPIDKFIVTIDFFLEALQYNPYYNKKICVSKTGLIKNCIKHTNSFGNINELELEKIMNNNEFKKLWFISHDKIIEIRDSELRYTILVSNNLKEVAPDLYSIITG